MNDLSSTQVDTEELQIIDLVDSKRAWPFRVDWPVYSNDQSGLPLTWVDDVPEAPVVSSRRAADIVAKRLFDILASGSALLLLAPLFFIVATLVKLTSKGPVFFKQDREGLGQSLFQIYKFRSLSIEHCDPTGVAQTVMNDQRVTPIGRFIRRTSIDELPQLFNVLRGDMSLVGPRPHVAGMYAGGRRYDDLVPYYHQRRDMLPGLTGWAQANGLRGPTTEAGVAIARVNHDIAYIQNFSFWLDCKILLMTLRHEFFSGSGH